MQRDPFVSSCRASLERLRRIGEALGASERVERVATAIDAELRGDLSPLYPRCKLGYLLELTDRYFTLRERAAPDVLTSFHDHLVLALLAALEHEAPGFFAPEPTTSWAADGWKLSYAPWGVVVPNHDLDPIDVAGPFLALLARPANAELWAQQRRLLGSLGGAATLFSMSILEAERATVTPERLLAHQRAGDRDGGWFGVTELPFLLGRVAQLLGPPPESEVPGATLTAQRATGGPIHHFGVGGSELYVFSDHRDEAAAAGRWLCDLLVSGPDVADVEMDGAVAGDERFRVGVRGGRLFCEPSRGPPWFGVPR